MNVRPVKFLRRSILLAAVVYGYLAASAWAQAPLTYTWINPVTGGIWSDPSQWSDITADGLGDVADGAGNTADFSTLNLTANNTVTMDADHTLGFLIFGDTTPSNDWTINNPGILTLATVAPNTTPAITVNNRTVTLNPVIAGTQGFNKNGAGTLAIGTGVGTITGNININAGALVFGNNTSGSVPASVQMNLLPGTTLTYSTTNGGGTRNVAMATQANVVNSIGSNSGSATLSGTGFTNAATGGTAAVINFVVTGNGNVNWGFAALNIINNNMFQNFGGTVSFGGVGTQTRVSGGNSTQNLQFAVLDLGTSTGGFTTKGGNNTVFIAGGLAGGNSTVLGSSTTGTSNTLIVGSADSAQTFTGGLFQSAASTNAPTVTKVGTGTWTVAPAAVYGTNALNLNANGGTFIENLQNLTTATDLFKNTSTLNFGGGTFQVLAKNTGATAQTFGAVTVNNGGGKLVVNTNGGTGTTLTLGAITATAAGGALNISSTGTGTVAMTSTGAPDATGTYGGKVTFTNSAGATDWLTSASAAAPFALSGYSAYANLPTAAATDTTNDIATGNVSLTGAVTTNSLKVTNTAASQSLNLGGNLLTLTNGGLLGAGANAYAVNNGTITSGLAATPSVTLNAYGGSSLTIGAAVVDSTVGPTALTKAGPGTVVLSGSNTFTGQAFLTSGITSVASDAPLGGGSGTISVATSDAANTSLTLTNTTLPAGFGVGATMLGRTVTAISGNVVTLSDVANTSLTNQNASWANAPQVNLNGGTLSASATASLAETNSGGATPASTANRNLVIGSGGGTLDVATGATLSVPGIVSSAGNQLGPLVKTGPGTLSLAATPAVSFNITTVNATTTATINSAAGLVVGQTITGAGIPNNATITAIDPVGLTVTLSANATAGDGTTPVPAAAYVANSYGGATILSGGTLSTAILVNGGINSGIGSSSAAAPALVLDGGFLRYTGAGGVAGNTNRTFTLTANGGGLDATGNTGAVVFSNTAPIVPDTALAGSGARTLTLTGNSTLDNTLAAQLIDNSATAKTNLNKTGAGTWVLSNPGSTFTGTTTVSGGTLKLVPVTPSANNIAASSVVTVNAGATLNVTGLTAGTMVVGAGQTLLSNGSVVGSVSASLGGTVGGTGTIGNAGAGSVSIQDGGILAPGSNGVGSVTVDKLSLTPASIMNYDFQISPSVANDLVNTGNLTLAGGLNLFKSGTTAQLTRTGTYQLLHYTGTLTGFDSSWSTVSGTNAHILNPVSGLTYGFSTTATPGFVSLVVGGFAPAEWNVDDSTHNWSDPNSWTANPPNAVGAIANFLTTITAARTVNVDAPQTVGVINFNNANKYTLAGTAKITFTNNGSAAAQINDANGSHQISAPIGLTSNLNVTVTNAADTMTISGGIPTATSSFIEKSGPGTLVLSGTNNYSGGTNIAGGTVQFAGLSSLGTGAVNLDSGTLKWATGNTADVSSLFVILTSAGGTLDTNGNNVTLASAVGGNGAGQLTKAGAGKLILTANNTFTGGTNITGGSVQIGNNTSGTGSVSTGNITIGAGTSLDINRTDDFTLANNIGGASGTLNKNNNNVLTLSGTNTFGTTAGGINLNGGTLRAGSSTAIANAGLTMAPTTTLDLNGFNAAVRSLSADGTDKIINAAPAVNFNITTTAATNTATVDNAAGLAVGQTIFGAGVPANTTITAIAGTTLTLSANATAGDGITAVPAAANGTAVVTMNLTTNTTYAGLLSNSADGTGALALTKAGIGNLTLTANNSMTGAVTVSGGGLILPAGGKLDHVGAVNVSGSPATLTVSGGSITTSTLSNVNNAGGVSSLIVSSGTATFNGGLNATGNANTGFLINVSGGTLTASSISMGRSGLSFTAQPAAGDTGSGLYIQGGTVNIAGDLAMATNGSANSSVSTRIDGGSLTVGGVTTVGQATGGRWSVLDVNNGGTFTSTSTATGVQLGFTTAGSAELLVRGTGVANVQKVQFGSTTTDVANQSGVVAVGVGGTNTGGTLNVGAGGLSRGVPMTTAGIPNMTAQVQLGENALVVANAAFSSDADWQILGATGATNGPTIQAADASGAPHDITITGALNGAAAAATTIITGPMLTKTGGGTLTLATLPTAPGLVNPTGVGPLLYSGKLAVNQGAFVLGQPNILPAVPTITLAAGTRFGTGSTDQNVLATLIVAGNATLDLGAGGLVGLGATGGVHFASSGAAATGVPWAGTLTIQNWTNGFDHLFFGADVTGLDATQLSAITFAGFGAAKINATTGEITPVNPGPVYKRGDLTLDGHVNAADLTAMLSALANPATYEAAHSLTNDSLFAIGDVDADGHFTNLDLQGMISFLQSGQGSVAPVPEPATIVLAGFAAAGLACIVRCRRKQA